MKPVGVELKSHRSETLFEEREYGTRHRSHQLLYAVFGGAITIIFTHFGYKSIDKLAKFDTSQELAKGNQGVGAMVRGMFIGMVMGWGLI